jgi:DNA-binding response OmpR family regulator
MPFVLVVDDHVENCVPLVRLFRHATMDAQPVASGQAALAAMAARRPDVVLLDVMMPDMDGFDVLGVIRADRRFDGVAVVMYTAVVDRESRVRALHMGAQGYVIKGTSFADLRAEILQLLPASPAHRADA